MNFLNIHEESFRRPYGRPYGRQYVLSGPYKFSLARVRGGDTGAAQAPRAVWTPLSGCGLSISVKNPERRSTKDLHSLGANVDHAAQERANGNDDYTYLHIHIHIYTYMYIYIYIYI